MFRLNENEDGSTYDKKEVDSILKCYATIKSEEYAEATNFDKSCSDMTHDEMQLLKKLLKDFGESIGFEVDEYNDLNFNR